MRFHSSEKCLPEKKYDLNRKYGGAVYRTPPRSLAQMNNASPLSGGWHCDLERGVDVRAAAARCCRPWKWNGKRNEKKLSGSILVGLDRWDSRQVTLEIRRRWFVMEAHTCDVRYREKTLKSSGWGVDNISFYLPTHSPPNPYKDGGGKEKQFGLDLLFVSNGPVCLGLDGKKFGRWPVTKTHDFSRPHR